MAKVGVEQSLSDVQSALQEKGHNVVQLKQEQDAKDCDCCVITGQDQDVMGISNAVTQGSVIEAGGLSANQIVQEVDNRLNR